MASNTDFLLALEDLSVSFDGFKAVDDLNLYIDKDELRVIIGPNGAGKTTRARPDLRPDAAPRRAAIKFKNQEITGCKEHRSCAWASAASSRRPSIYENLTVFENLEISFPRGRSVSARCSSKRTDEVTRARATRSPR